MFGSFSRTIALMKMSWRVLLMDRELILFPVFAALALLVLSPLLIGVADATGTTNHILEQGSWTVADAAVVVVTSFVSSAVIIFFNAALVAAALERLRGGDPNVKSGLKAALRHSYRILAWALISVAVTLVLAALRERGGLAGRVASMIGGIAWSLATFFVIPVLVSEGLGPLAAIKRSASLMKATWGSQVTANFGFTIIGVVATVVALVPASLLFMFVHPVAGIAVGVPAVVIVLAATQALVGIFKAALYDFANGDDPHGFDRESLASAYRAQ